MAILRLSNVSVAVDIKVYSVPSEGGINLVEVGLLLLHVKPKSKNSDDPRRLSDYFQTR